LSLLDGRWNCGFLHRHDAPDRRDVLRRSGVLPARATSRLQVDEWVRALMAADN